MPKKYTSSGNRGERLYRARVKTAKGRRLSSTLWLDRQLNDPYVHLAKKEGFRSRAAYKLMELDEKFGFLSRAHCIVDLGAAPGGWSQVVAKRVKGARVIALDIIPMDPLSGVESYVADVMSEEGICLIKKVLGGQKADVVLSDMATASCGHPATDHIRIMALCEMAYGFACEVLAPGGTFLAKILQGGTEGEMLQAMKQRFSTVKHVKPPASRKDSSEFYVLAKGFKGKKDAGT